MEKDCAFCATLRLYQNINAYNDTVYSSEKLVHEYGVALVSGAYKKGQKNKCGTITDYNHKKTGFALNYCPTCGTKLWEGA
jgi:PHP family Zn ribbon phosphoesterase